ncbi:hypothetical protein [Xenorhabdus ishibashii]|uniref:Uncharacterized protein n=1 Tax=Xenorhabdus ishibashii TaxID=1034471 RepID=A0A2D0KG61_9GAMM|nr:hypothetical protein [Xenorhabdus ishibashii]PHM62414.1 hypothetical protein Xish_01616 [Xenorhabdus ishibashii]
MRNIKVFRGVYTFEDTYRSHFRLSICAHGEYDTEHFTGYLVIPKENQTIGRITPAQLYDQLSKEGVMISKFRYIRLIACDSATCEKDSPDSPYNFEDSFASEFSKLCPNNIVIGYLGLLKYVIIILIQIH